MTAEEEYDRMVEHLKSACATCVYSFRGEDEGAAGQARAENAQAMRLHRRGDCQGA